VAHTSRTLRCVGLYVIGMPRDHKQTPGGRDLAAVRNGTIPAKELARPQQPGW
jgi:hypothetical protein